MATIARRAWAHWRLELLTADSSIIEHHSHSASARGHRMLLRLSSTAETPGCLPARGGWECPRVSVADFLYSRHSGSGCIRSSPSWTKCTKTRCGNRIPVSLQFKIIPSVFFSQFAMSAPFTMESRRMASFPALSARNICDSRWRKICTNARMGTSSSSTRFTSWR